MRIKALNCALVSAFLVGNFIVSNQIRACSTSMLAKAGHLIFGHNLNQNGVDVPGMIFINKRGVFKTARTWSEIINKDRLNSSSLTWISRYGSVTCNAFGRDFPDGVVNEVGLYIWEMSEKADYPRNEQLPKLMDMNWMQFILDSYSTIDQAIQSASEIDFGSAHSSNRSL